MENKDDDDDDDDECKMTRCFLNVRGWKHRNVLHFMSSPFSQWFKSENCLI